MVLNAIRFLLSDLIASMATILINFQAKVRFSQTFSTFHHQISKPKKISRTLKKCFKIFVKLARKMLRILLELCISQSTQAT